MQEKTGKDLVEVLKLALEMKGPKIFLEPRELDRFLAAEQVEEKRIYQMLLLCRVPGYQNILREDQQTRQTDVDRFVKNACEYTGLSRATVLEMTESVMRAIGCAVIDSKEQFTSVCLNEKHAFVIPRQLYEQEYAELRKKIRRDIGITVEDIECLSRLGSVGINEAQCDLARIVMKVNDFQAICLLEQAAADGSSAAGAMLGDIHYAKESGSHWTEAYRWYTGYGAAALNFGQRNALRNILNHKKYNLRIFTGAFALLFCMALQLWIMGRVSLYSEKVAVGRLALLAAGIVYCVGVRRFLKYPYDFLNWLIPAMAGLWWGYLIIWVLG